MIKYNTTIRTVIENVEEVVIGEVEKSILSGYDRFITIKTKQGETVCLLLYADEPKKLDLRDEPQPDSDWIIPKVYKGKSVHERELEDEK